MQKYLLQGITGVELAALCGLDCGRKKKFSLWAEGPGKLGCQGSEQKSLPGGWASHWSSADSGQGQI